MIAISSSFSEAKNLNRTLVTDVAEGMKTIVGDENVNVFNYRGLEDQIIKSRPELVLLIGSPVCDQRHVANACRKVGALFAFWTVEDPYEFDWNGNFIEYADIVFSNDAWAVSFYDHPRVHHLPLAASPRYMTPLDCYQNRSLDLLFCGAAFSNRMRFVSDAKELLSRYNSLIIGPDWPRDIGRFIDNSRVSTSHLRKLYSQSYFVLNIGREFSFANRRRGLQAVTPGPRTFEAAMVGTVQLYFQPSCFLTNYYDVGTEIVSCETVPDLEERMVWLISHPEDALKIARASQTRTICEHTYAHRSKFICEIAGIPVASS